MSLRLGNDIIPRVAFRDSVSSGNIHVDDALITKTITEYSNDRVESIGDFIFRSCSALTAVDFPKVTNIGSYAFRNCSVLTTVDFSKITSLGGYSFCGCSALTTVNFPAIKTINASTFADCSSLTDVDFSAITRIYASAFNNCTILRSLIIRTTQMCTLANVTAISTSGIASGTGYIYVPSSLLSSYQAATNWSTYSAQFRALEQYTVDGTITGALDPSKI